MKKAAGNRWTIVGEDYVVDTEKTSTGTSDAKKQ